MRSIKLGIVALVSMVGLVGCPDVIVDAFTTCTPTVEQRADCDWQRGERSRAVGTARHQGYCQNHEVACVERGLCVADPDGGPCQDAGAGDAGNENAAQCAADGGVGCDG